MITVKVLSIDGVEIAEILEGEHDTGVVLTALGKSYTLIPLITEKEFEELEGRIRTLANTVEIILATEPDEEVRYKLQKFGFEGKKAVIVPREPSDLADSILNIGFAMYPKEAFFHSIFGAKVCIPNLSKGQVKFAIHYPIHEFFDVRAFFEEAFITVMRWVEKWRGSSGLKNL